MINNILLVSGIQQSDSIINISILFQIPFPFRLLQTIELSSLCYAVGPSWLLILNIACQPQLPIHPSPPFTPRTMSLSVSLWVCFCFVDKVTCVYIYIHTYIYIIYIYSAYKWYHVIFVFIWLTLLSIVISKSIRVTANGIVSFYLMDE